ncbi:MAG: ROK family glucokinase [Lachnospiraceae bacterium]|nr:ROK family glucokinase [Lachnospiraceae bacterium]
MKKYCFGIDVGGTTVKMGFFETSGKLIDKWEINTNTDNYGENILADICDAMDRELAKQEVSLDDIEGVGIGLPGPITADGTVIQCVNLGWGTFNVEEKLSSMYHGIKVKAGNDANVAALGEAWQGGGKDFNSLVMITLGTGVGGGIIIDGKILTGATGGAGEVGHMHVAYDETDFCNCGRKGCLEQKASATGIVKEAKRYMERTDAPTKMRDFANITAKDVFDLAKDGDEGALAVVDEMSKYLGLAMAHIAVVVNPDAFIIGGGVSKAGQFLLDSVKVKYRESCFGPCGEAALRLATLGNDAGMYGAAAQIVL